ncbi:MAG: ATP-binding cassette domain-containing protein [Planctomycetaceae bacterium]|nr:ATP-binding cassette domain-containing protein [Planctomycetaceae bacterium]
MKRQNKSSVGKAASKSVSAASASADWLIVCGARQNNLKDIDVPFPIGAVTAVTGVSGSGKSSLINDILWKSLAKKLHRANTQPGKFDRIDGGQYLNKVIRVDQQPIGQTPTSNPATYTGVFDLIREIFAQLTEARLRGYSARRFSFNVSGGRCEKCEGAGQQKIEMHFLPDVWVTCDSCNGKRYESQTLEVLFHGHSISDVLEMPVKETAGLFQNIPSVRRILQTLCDVGLDYITLGQSAPTLSGGESQRLKLATELARPDTGRTLYLLDEPTTGLHFDDLVNLLNVLHRLVDLGNTVIVIEHNLDIIKNADWIVDLGPEAGTDGGYLVFAGTPEELVSRDNTTGNKRKTSKGFYSYTADALLPVLKAGPVKEREKYDPNNLKVGTNSAAGVSSHTSINVSEDNDYGTKPPWTLDGFRWHTQTGKPRHWDGRILTEIVNRIEKSGFFTPADWNHRSTVSVEAKQAPLGWFLRAVTSGEWLLKIRFRVPPYTFHRTKLIENLSLKPLNDADVVSLYGEEQRIRVHRPVGRWQEIEISLYSWAETDTPAFWNFLTTAIQAFTRPKTPASAASQEDLLPWKALGEKWHFLDKGLSGGTKRRWNISLLTDLFDIIKKVNSELLFVWGHQCEVPVYRTGREKSGIPLCMVNTKRAAALILDIFVPKSSVTLKQIAKLGSTPEVKSFNTDCDAVRLYFTKESELELKKKELIKLLHIAKNVTGEAEKK